MLRNRATRGGSGRQECLPHNSVRWILFDAVGTLIYANPPVARAYCAIGKRYGSRLNTAEIGARFRLALAAEHRGDLPTSEATERQRWRRIVGAVIDDAPAYQEKIFRDLWRHFARSKSWRLFPDARVALDKLQLRGYRLGIASNFDHRLYEIVRRNLAFRRIKAIFVSSDIGFAKPHPSFFRAIEERLDVDPAHIALVGDDEISDVQGATAAGWRAIRLDRSGQCAAAGTIHSLAELV